MKIVPYKSVGGLEFGVSEAQAIASLGNPLSQRKNRRKEVELKYENATYRFEAVRGLLECSGNWEAIEINNAVIPTKLLPNFLKENDSQATEEVGFIVSRRFGLAIDTEHEGWVTIFEKGRWNKI